MKSVRPKYEPEPDASSLNEAPRAPVMKLCHFDPAAGHLTIPRDVRDKWLSDPVRRNLVQHFTDGFTHERGTVH